MAAVVAAFAVLLFWLLVLSPRGSEIQSLEAEVSTAKADLGSLSARLGSLKGADLGALQAELATYRGEIPPTPDEPGIIQVLLDAATSSKVSLTGIEFAPPGPAPAAPVSLISLSFAVQGSYFDLAQFLFELEHLDRLAYVRTVSVAPGDSGLVLGLTMDVFTTDTNAGPGSDLDTGPQVGA